jgi:carbon-monoxide dehydrogenase small subunit
MKITLTVNGAKHSLEVEPRETLLQVIRDRLGLTGAKGGCETGECGACTVLLDSKAVNSCLILAPEADGCDVVTVEGLQKGRELHPLQRAFVEEGAVQCGYCTPGLLMVSASFLRENPHPTEDSIRRAIEGNLCRCGTYPLAIKAIARAAEEMGGR